MTKLSRRYQPLPTFGYCRDCPWVHNAGTDRDAAEAAIEGHADFSGHQTRAVISAEIIFQPAVQEVTLRDACLRYRHPIHGHAGNITTTQPVPYQWRRDGRTRDTALRAAGLGTTRLADPPPRPRSRMTRAEIAAAIAELQAAAQEVTQ